LFVCFLDCTHSSPVARVFFMEQTCMFLCYTKHNATGSVGGWASARGQIMMSRLQYDLVFSREVMLPASLRPTHPSYGPHLERRCPEWKTRMDRKADNLKFECYPHPSSWMTCIFVHASKILNEDWHLTLWKLDVRMILRIDFGDESWRERSITHSRAHKIQN
jgi:hypothetical protein